MGGSVIIEKGHAMDQADIIYAVKDVGQTKSITDSFLSAPVSIINELGVKLSITKHERCIKGIEEWSLKIEQVLSVIIL